MLIQGQNLRIVVQEQVVIIALVALRVKQQPTEETGTTAGRVL